MWYEVTKTMTTSKTTDTVVYMFSLPRVFISQYSSKVDYMGTLNSKEWKMWHHNAGMMGIAGEGKLWKANMLTIYC